MVNETTLTSKTKNPSCERQKNEGKWTKDGHTEDFRPNARLFSHVRSNPVDVHGVAQGIKEQRIFDVRCIQKFAENNGG
jgi:hypothetical protein